MGEANAFPARVLVEGGEAAGKDLRSYGADCMSKASQTPNPAGKLELLARESEHPSRNRLQCTQMVRREGFQGLLGASPKMQEVYRLIEAAVQRSFPVLVLGETGTGKELVARSIHHSGPRAHQPFVPVDCSAVAPTLIESELFGYVRGAFTGAVCSRRGLIEAANRGTLFLDEIGNLPVQLQAKLLRALQEKEIRPVGATDRVRTEVRVIAATNQALDAAICNGSFRRDLYYRLNVVEIRLPPLRERRSDIPLLAHAFVKKFAADSLDPNVPRTIAGDTMARLVAHDWPGNVRELQNVMERGVALGSSPVLRVCDLPSNMNHSRLQSPLSTDDTILPLDELERRAILRALHETGGDKLAAARVLGIGKTTLYRKLKQYESTEPEPSLD